MNDQQPPRAKSYILRLNQRFFAQMAFEAREVWEDLRHWRFYRMLFFMIIGIFMGAYAINALLVPHHFFSGGTSGLTLMVFYVFGKPSLGVLYLLFNIPLFIIGWREYALRYVFVSIIGVFMYSGALALTDGMVWQIENRSIAAVMAGILMGGGTGLYLREGGSAGGMDILAKFIRKHWAIPMSTSLNFVNLFNLGGAWYFYDLEIAFYSAIYLGVLAWVMNKVQVGMAQHRAVLIITTRPEAVSQRIREELRRGVTFLQALGGYSKQSINMIYTVINLYELGRLKNILYMEDEQAFLTVMEAAEVIGHSFQTFEDDGYRRPFIWQEAHALSQNIPEEGADAPPQVESPHGLR